MNTVILSSVISAGNHALFAGTRVLYGLATASHAPPIFAWTTRGGVPLPALLLTSSISALCFGSTFIENGQLWAWLQNLVGVSNQVRRFVFTCCCCFFFLLTDALLDCLALHWYRVVEIQERVEVARPSALGDEVSRAVDMAVGSSFRGAFARFVLFFLPPNVSLTRPFASHRIAPPIDHSRISHLTQCVRYTHTPFFYVSAIFSNFCRSPRMVLCHPPLLHSRFLLVLY